jgi:hypothetical protein
MYRNLSSKVHSTYGKFKSEILNYVGFEINLFKSKFYLFGQHLRFAYQDYLSDYRYPMCLTAERYLRSD